jgi:HD-like signal output (HDOD) protein
VLAEPTASCADVARVIERDAAMSLKVLQLGGSTFFGDGEGEVTRISEAVVRLGLPLLRTLWKTEGVFEKLTSAAEGFDAPAVQARSRLVATLSAEILGEDGEAGLAFLAARLRDVGQLALATREPVRFAEALATARAERRPLHRVEQEVFGTDHAAVAGYLLGIWGLPTPLVDAVTNHLQPERMQPTRLDPLGALHLAEALIAEALMEVSPDPISPALFTLGGVEEHLPDWRARARGIVASASR